MAPEKLFFLDKKIIKNDRVISCIFSLALAFILFLVERGVIDTYNFSYPIFWVGFITFVLLGFIQLYWNPYTQKKVLVYNFIYALLGALISVTIVGFLTPIVYLAWLMLLLTTSIYFPLSILYATYLIFFTSSFMWIIDNSSLLSIGDITNILASSIFVGLISLFIASIWDLFGRSVKNLEKSRSGEKLVSERMGSLINSMVDGVFALDEEGKIVIYNGAAINILDLNIDLHNKTFDKIATFLDKDNQKFNMHDFVMETKSQRISRDIRIKYSDDSIANLYISVAPVHLGFGRKGDKGFVILVRDITREKSLEEERNEFISVISHELRTPIAIAEGEIGNAEFLAQKNKADKAILEGLKMSHDQILFLSGMINDLSTLSRAERGKLNVDIEELDINELVKELTVDYTPQAEAKKLKLTSQINGELKLQSSKLYTREILQNFITNAIKYTEKGSVTVIAEAYDKGIKFSVEDTGIGISTKDQEKVFDKFFRSEDYRTRANNGTGLGLYVTMKLARLIHAEIELESELNKGSKFIISMPNLK
jgi:two-component system, OmpR family, phosphate regulon sensor histidine kinase PhoR